MSGFISEFFGYRAEDNSKTAVSIALQQTCPFLNGRCTKNLSRDNIKSGVCSIRPASKDAKPVICCPIRLYAEDYKILREVSHKAFGKEINLYAGRVALQKAKEEGMAVAVFGKGWGGELHLPQRSGTGAYFVDWVLALIDCEGELQEFIAIEVQTIDTTGNYRTARQALLETKEIVIDTVGFNWENVAKRIIPQVIYKGQVLQREELCKKGLYFVCPKAVYDKIIKRLGGKEKLAKIPTQPASIHFFAYDYIDSDISDGKIKRLGLVEEHNTSVYKVQEAFSSLDLPNENIYRDAILKALRENQ